MQKGTRRKTYVGGATTTAGPTSAVAGLTRAANASATGAAATALARGALTENNAQFDLRKLQRAAEAKATTATLAKKEAGRLGTAKAQTDAGKAALEQVKAAAAVAAAAGTPEARDVAIKLAIKLAKAEQNEAEAAQAGIASTKDKAKKEALRKKAADAAELAKEASEIAKRVVAAPAAPPRLQPASAGNESRLPPPPISPVGNATPDGSPTASRIAPSLSGPINAALPAPAPSPRGAPLSSKAAAPAAAPVAAPVAVAAKAAAPVAAPGSSQGLKKTAKNYIRNATNGKQAGLRDYKGEKVPYWNTNESGNPLPDEWKRSLSIKDGRPYYYSGDISQLEKPRSANNIIKSATNGTQKNLRNYKGKKVPIWNTDTNGAPLPKGWMRTISLRTGKPYYYSGDKSQVEIPTSIAEGDSNTGKGTPILAPPSTPPLPTPEQGATVESATVESAPVESATVKSAPVESATVESATVKSPTVEGANSGEISHINRVIKGINQLKNYVKPLPKGWTRRISKSTGKIVYYKKGASQNTKGQFERPTNAATGGRKRTRRRDTRTRRSSHRHNSRK
jgi:hypothetical protein